eukprot:8115772-Lingulodinium_polyedra.AAC.1
MVSALQHLVCFDQVNARALAGCDVLCRKSLQVQRAAKRSPKSPDFRGLDVMVESKLETGGQLQAPQFA